LEKRREGKNHVVRRGEYNAVSRVPERREEGNSKEDKKLLIGGEHKVRSRRERESQGKGTAIHRLRLQLMRVASGHQSGVGGSGEKPKKSFTPGGTQHPHQERFVQTPGHETGKDHLKRWTGRQKTFLSKRKTGRGELGGGN